MNHHFVKAVLGCFLLVIGSIAQAEPKIKEVLLHPRTTLSVEIVPDMGTRFSFPFILDEDGGYVPYTLTLTNATFLNKREAGRNFFVITADKTGGKEVYGNIFLAVAGYEITVELRTTTNINKHYSDIVFKLTDEDRENLIQKAIAQRTKAMEDEHQRKMDVLEMLADNKAMMKVGRLALSRPQSTSVNEVGELELPNGDAVTLFVDEVVTYDPYDVIVFEIESDSYTQGATVLDVKLFAVNADTGTMRVVTTGNDVPPRVNPGEFVRGSITMMRNELGEKESLKLAVQTDKGPVEAKW